MKKILLTRGKFALVDNADFEWLNQWRWHYQPHHSGKGGYAKRNVWRKGVFESVNMARLILDILDSDYQVDHINGDKLDNRKCNLRKCTLTDNNRNKKIYKNNMVGYKGVHKVGNGFQARIMFNRKFINLGFFKDITKAALAYDEAAKKYFRKYSNVNYG